MELELNELEKKNLEMIQKHLTIEFGLTRLTPTMFQKAIIDASELIRKALLRGDFIDYSKIGQGPNYKLVKNGLFFTENKDVEIEASFYRPKTKKGDPRFWIYNLKNLNIAKVDDLIFISVLKLKNEEAKLLAINLSNSILEETKIELLANSDELLSRYEEKLSAAINELFPLVKEIMKSDPVPNYKGAGKQHYKDVGQTFEHLLNIKDNSDKRADYKNLIELKAKRVKAKSKDTLFSMVPNYNYASIKGSNEMIRTFGYPSNKYPDFIDLFVTVSTKENNQGLYLKVNENEEWIEQWYLNSQTGKKELTCVWLFNDIEKRLFDKHNTTLWCLAKEQIIDDTVYFDYFAAELSKRPSLSAFITLVKTGDIIFDWRGRVKENRTGYKDKGHAWRMKPTARKILFGEVEPVSIAE